MSFSSRRRPFQYTSVSLRDWNVEVCHRRPFLANFYTYNGMLIHIHDLSPLNEIYISGPIMKHGCVKINPSFLIRSLLFNGDLISEGIFYPKNSELP